MFSSPPKLFWHVKVMVVTVSAICPDAFCEEEPSSIAVRELEGLAIAVATQKSGLETETQALKNAEEDVAALQLLLQTAETNATAAEKNATDLVKQLTEAQKKLDTKPTDAVLKTAVEEAKAKAAAAALKARQEVVVRDDAQSKLKESNDIVVKSQLAVDAATAKFQNAERDLKKLTETLLSSAVVAESVATAAKSAESAAKSSESAAKSIETVAESAEAAAKSEQAAGKSVESVAKSAETAAKSAEMASKSVEAVAKSAETAAQSIEAVAKSAAAAGNSIELAAKSSETAAKSAETAAGSAAMAAKSAADTMELITAAAKVTNAAESSQHEASPASTLGVAERDSGPSREVPAPCQTDSAGSEADASCKAIDAFRLLPLVATIEGAESLEDFCEDGSHCDCSKPYALDYRFDAPAHFPLPAFGLHGQRIEGEGAIIYEGMRLAIRDDGSYQVRFVIETPAMPVTMRLQLHLEDNDTNNRYTLTLPPIRIPEQQKVIHRSEAVPPKLVYANVQTVHHEGYLPVLAGQQSSIQVVRRTGSARFGFGVDIP